MMVENKSLKWLILEWQKSLRALEPREYVIIDGDHQFKKSQIEKLMTSTK